MWCFAALVLSVLVAGCCVSDSESARILALFYFNGKSHFIMFEALLKDFAAEGHRVYVLGHFPQKKPVPNYTDISVEGSLHTLVNNVTLPSVIELGKYFTGLWRLCQGTRYLCEIVLERGKVKELLNSND
jgi:glucuronosyltransferase